MQYTRNTFENIFDLCIWSFNFLLILNFSGAVLLILSWAGFWECRAGKSKERQRDCEKESEDFQDNLFSLRPFANPIELWDYLSAN